MEEQACHKHAHMWEWVSVEGEWWREPANSGAEVERKWWEWKEMRADKVAVKVGCTVDWAKWV